MATIEGSGSGNVHIGNDAENDSIWGAGGADVLYGGAVTGGGNDLLDGGNGSDTLYGGDGNDTLVGGSGNTADVLYGGAGIDTADFSQSLTDLDPSPVFLVNTTAVNVNLASGVATGLGTDQLFGIENVIGGGGADIITGNAGDNLLIGGAGNDTMDGGAGNDTIEGGTGSDFLTGGPGIDVLSFTNSATAVNANLQSGFATGEGTDTLAGFENLTGSRFADTLTGDGGANVISGGIGSDRLYGGGGNDSLFGGTDADTIYGGTGSDSIDAGTGTNLVFGGGGNDSILGGVDADTFYGGVGNDTLNGSGGADLIYGGPEFGTTGTAGATGLQFNWSDYADELNLAGGVTQDTGGINVAVSYSGNISGASFTTERTGATTGTDEREYAIYVGSGEPFSASSSAEVFRPNDGGGSSSSSVQFDFSAVAGSGLDSEVQNLRFRISDVDVSGFTDSVTVRAFDADGNEMPITITVGNPATLSRSGNTVTAIGTSVFPNSIDGSVLYQIEGPVARVVVEYTDLNSAQQAIRISDLHFDAVALVDNDSLIGGDGDDTIFGGIGQDTILGNLGDDRIYGGLGNDSIDAGEGNDLIYGDEGNDLINFGSGADTVYGGGGNDLIDDVAGTSLPGANLIYGGDGSDTVWAGDDADTIYGDAGPDVLSGEAGNDRVFGGIGNDQLYGGDGLDTLFADEGNDSLYGDAGNDILFGGLGADLIYGGDDRDSISASFADVTGLENVFGGGSGVDNDTLRMDITGFGWAQMDLTYDPLNAENGTVTFFAVDGTTVLGTLNFTDIENLVIVCFTAGTRIMTEGGPVAVEDLTPGDLVTTRDNGLQPLRWVGRIVLSAADLQARPELQPVRIGAGALGSARPDRSMMLSPQHRVLVEGARAEMYFGESEVLVPAKHLIGLAEITRTLPSGGVTYVHILFDRHEIVLSDGIWTESFQPAERTLGALEDAARAEVLALFPELIADATLFPAARLTLKAHEARVLVSV